MLTGVKELSVSSEDMKYTQNKHFTISNGIIFDYLISIRVFWITSIIVGQGTTQGSGP